MPFPFMRFAGARGGRRPRFMHPAIVTPLLAMLLIAGAMFLSNMGLHLRNSAQAAAADAPVPFHGTIAAQVKHSRLLGPANASQRISLSIGLHPRNEQELNNYAQDISHPKSANFHRFLTPVQFTAVFGPSQSNYNAMLHFLQTSGFTITHTYSHRLSIAFTGTIGQVERVFQVKINNYAAADGRVYYANNGDPILPVSLANVIESISGLNNATLRSHPPMLTRKLAVQAQGAKNAANSSIRCLGNGNGYYTPSQIASAYNLQRLYASGYRGEGQTVALFELDSYSRSDLSNYASCYGQAQTAIHTIVTGSGKVPTDGGVTEVELDAELVLSAAPKLGQLDIYEAANDAADYNAEWAQIIQDVPPVVSTSWGACEQDIGQQEAQQENTYFTAAEVQGQTVFAASGDSGSAGCAFDGSSPANNTLNVSDPASQPYVTAVGGTSLSLTNSKYYNGETVWNNAPDPQISYKGGASGGGISQFWAMPSWQQNYSTILTKYNIGTLCGQQEDDHCRQVPDVSLNADPYYGYPVYCSVAAAGCANSGGWYAIGGTSAAAPMWAAMMALTNEMSVKAGDFNVGFASEMLYWLDYNTNSVNWDTPSFHDITTGNNDYNKLHDGRYQAGPGYDLATGLGSFDAYTLATTIVKYLQYYYSFDRTSYANTTWYFAEGSVGGSFQEYLTLQNPNPAYAAVVSITYLFHAKKPVTVTHSVPASSRTTISVNADLHIKPTDNQQSLSAIVQSTNGIGIVAERPMYFNFKGIASGTDVMGTTTPQTSYYFPEADTTLSSTSQYYTYISILNPSSTNTATATLTFYTGSCGQTNQAACPTKTVVVPPLQRATSTPPANLHRQMAIAVTANKPVVAERPMYFKDVMPTAGGAVQGATTITGSPTPGTDWLFAEGYTGPSFQEKLVLANFGQSQATASVKLEYSNGHTQTVSVPVPALGQAYFDVNAANAHPSGTCDVNPCQSTSTVSAEVTSDNPIVADRLMFFHYGSEKYAGGTEAVGESGPTSHNVYTFAEGFTANSFSEFLTLQNPHNYSITVMVTFFADTYVIQQQMELQPHSRQTISVNKAIVPIATNYNNQGINSYAVSVIVEASNNLIVERPMYFNYHGDQGGTDVLGYATKVNTCDAVQPEVQQHLC